jgi:hypothetical protein
MYFVVEVPNVLITLYMMHMNIYCIILPLIFLYNIPSFISRYAAIYSINIISIIRGPFLFLVSTRCLPDYIELQVLPAVRCFL